MQKLVTLADHETVIIVDREGRYTFRSGHREEERAFFIPPYCNLVTLMWSDGPDKEQRTLPVTKIDMRPSFMTYKFTCRSVWGAVRRLCGVVRRLCGGCMVVGARNVLPGLGGRE